ncbi:MAG: DUF3226 domain-containing protein [Saprospiraceae bacterium]
MNSYIKSILLVEGTTDEQFIHSLINFISASSKVEVQLIHIDKIFGSSNNDLENKLKSLITDLRNKPILNLGIILDKDDYSEVHRSHMINVAISNAGISISNPLSETNTVSDYPINSKRNIAISYFLIKDGSNSGNIETLLSEIISATPYSANCLNEWKSCSESRGVNVKQSDYLKEWLKIYIRYDYCIQNKLHSHAGEYCTLEKSFQKMNDSSLINKPWDYNHKTLTDLKTYLTKFL